MNVAEMKQALETAADDASISIRTASGEACSPSAIHIGAGGDATGTVTIECAPQESTAAAQPEDEPMDDVDAMAMKAGLDIGKKKPAKKNAPPVETDEEE